MERGLTDHLLLGKVMNGRLRRLVAMPKVNPIDHPKAERLGLLIAAMAQRYTRISLLYVVGEGQVVGEGIKAPALSSFTRSL